MGSTWQVGSLRIAALVGAAILFGGGLWTLWAARHRSEGERVRLPGLGQVGVPTCLAFGLCFLALGYHLLAYGLLPRFTLWAVPIHRWWIVAGAVGVMIAASLAAERLERHHD